MFVPFPLCDCGGAVGRCDQTVVGPGSQPRPASLALRSGGIGLRGRGGADCKSGSPAIGCRGCGERGAEWAVLGSLASLAASLELLSSGPALDCSRHGERLARPRGAHGRRCSVRIIAHT